ncbi:MAG: oligosaccharide flippase family protein [Bacteroidetes bacterium]|nr:oligosaccharide flippase family protein [Bacteroidota bacterium]
MISRQFFKSSMIYSIIGALPYTTGVILIPFFTARLTPVQFGINAIYFTFMYFVQLVASAGMDTYVGVNYFQQKDDPRRLREFLGTVLIVLITLGTAIMFIMLMGGSLLFRVIFRGDTALQFFPFGMITVVTAIFNGFFKTYSNLLVNQQRPERFFWLNISNFIIILAASLGILYAYPYTLNGPIIGRMVPAVISCLASVVMLTREYGLKFSRKHLDGMLAFCGPMIIYGAMIWVVNYIDRYVIKYFMIDPTYVGIFDFAVKLSLGIGLLHTGLVNTIQPKVFNIWKDKGLKESTPEVNRYYNAFTAITLLVLPLVTIAIPLLVPIVIKNHIYYQAFAFIGILCLGYATSPAFYLFLAPVFYFKKTRVLPKVFLYSAAIQLVMSSLLVWKFGLMGAVFSNFLIKPIQAFFLYFESRKFFTYHLNKWKLIYLPFIIIVTGILLYCFSPDKTGLIPGCIQLVITIVLVYFSYKRELLNMVIPIFKRRAV